MSKFHMLKTIPPFFEQITSGKKKFEIRKNDRDFKVGDYLQLREYDSVTKEYTERETNRIVTHIMRKEGVPFGLREGYCIMSITNSILT